MSPLFIEVMVWHYSRETRYGGEKALTEPQRKALQQGVDQKMLAPIVTADKKTSQSDYNITDRGTIYVKSLINVGFPIAAWDANYPATIR